MAYFIPEFEEIRSCMLRDARNLDPEAHIGPDSDHYIRATVTASAIEGIYDHQRWIVRQVMPDTADTEFLEIHARLRGIIRKPATRAQGHIIVSGLDGATIPIGTEIRDLSNVIYYTTKTITLQAESKRSVRLQVMQAVPCTAKEPGSIPSCQDVLARFSAPPTGIDTDVLLTIAGGAESESDGELLIRLLEHMRNPSGGGTANDYKRWALEIPGVRKAFVHPLYRGPGTVDIVLAGDNGAIPHEVVKKVQEHIDALRPVTASSVKVMGAVPKSIDIEVGVATKNMERVESLSAGIRTALNGVFESYEPGSSIILTQLLAAVMSVPGVKDAAILLPLTNIALNITESPQLGVVSIKEL